MLNPISGGGGAAPPVTRRSFLRRTGAGLAAAGGGVLLASCGGDTATSQSGGGGGGGGTDSVTFLNILPMESMTFAAEMLADAGGHFAEHGLDVSFQSTRGSAQAFQSIIAGNALLTRVGQVETMLAIADQGAPVHNVGTLIKESTIRFVSTSNDPLEKPEDFRGKTIGLPSEGGTSETTLDLVLSVGGFDPQSANRQVVGLAPGVYNLVQQGRIAGYAVSIDTAAILRKRNPDVVVFSPGSVMATGAQLYMVSEAGLADDREVIERYLAAIRAATQFMIDDADSGFAQTLEQMRTAYDFETLQDDEVAIASLEEYVRTWTVDGEENLLRTVPEAWQGGYEELVEAGFLEAGQDIEQWYTNDLLPQ